MSSLNVTGHSHGIAIRHTSRWHRLRGGLEPGTLPGHRLGQGNFGREPFRASGGGSLNLRPRCRGPLCCPIPPQPLVDGSRSSRSIRGR
jgi:hypothetical protein